MTTEVMKNDTEEDINDVFKPNIMGENLDTGPIKLVRLVPVNDIAKSITANAINRPPTMLINDVPLVSSFTLFIFFSFGCLFFMSYI